MAKKRKTEHTHEDNYTTLSKAYDRLISDFNILQEAYERELRLFELLASDKVRKVLEKLVK